jgi:hypothetical protein
MKFHIGEFYEKLSCFLNFILDHTCLMKILHEDLSAFLLVYPWIFIREETISNE